jgi:P-type Cu+ transporter
VPNSRAWRVAEAHARTGGVDGQPIMYVAVNGKVVGLLGVADPIKQTTPEAVSALRGEGLRVVMLSGGGRATAEAGSDAPALAQAEVGIAMGTGTDGAVESAGVTLVKRVCRASVLNRSPRPPA